MAALGNLAVVSRSATLLAIVAVVAFSGSANAQKAKPKQKKRAPAAVVAPSVAPSSPRASPSVDAEATAPPAVTAPDEPALAGLSADPASTTTTTSAQVVDTGVETKANAAPASPSASSPDGAKPKSAEDKPAGGSNEAAGGEHRTIDGFRFITPIEAYSAFANSSFRFAQGFGVVSFEMPSPITNQPTAGRLFLYGQQFLGQIGIGNRVAIDLRAEGAAGVGGNLDSILGVGALATLNAGAMPKARLFTLEHPALQVSLGTGAFYVRNIQVRPSALVGKLVGDVQGSEGQLVQQTSSLNLVPALMAAIAFGPIGFQTSIAPSFGVVGDVKEVGLSTGLHGSLDFHRLTRSVPVALVAEWGLQKYFDAASSITNSLGGGVYYSGKRDFELGVVARTTPGTLSIIQGQMVMQYYF